MVRWWFSWIFLKITFPFPQVWECWQTKGGWVWKEGQRQGQENILRREEEESWSNKWNGKQRREKQTNRQYDKTEEATNCSGQQIYAPWRQDWKRPGKTTLGFGLNLFLVRYFSFGRIFVWSYTFFSLIPNPTINRFYNFDLIHGNIEKRIMPFQMKLNSA